MWKDRLISDKEFFLDVLDQNNENLASVFEYAKNDEFDQARIAFAKYVRTHLQPEKLLQIPFEFPENVFMLKGESLQEAAKRICDYRLMSVGQMSDFSETREVDWESNPTSNQYKEWTWQLNRHNEWKVLSAVYLETKDEDLAKCFADMFYSWINQVQCPVNISGYETKAFRTIECGIRMGSNWPFALHAFVHSPHFTDNHIVAWYKSVFEQGRRLRTSYTKANWFLMEMNGLGHIGVLFPEFSQAKEWLDFAIRSLRDQLYLQFYPDGFQYELTTVYHDVSVKNYQRFIDLAMQYEVPIPDDFLSILEKATEINIKVMMPNGKLPDINDGRMITCKEIIEPKLRIFPENQMMKWLLDTKNTVDAPEELSYHLNNSGIGIYRTSWEKDATYVLFDGGPFGRAHQHEDKLNLLIYAKEKLIITEAGDYAYDDSPMRKYILTTAAHNAILVDEAGQNRLKNYSWDDADITLDANMQWVQSQNKLTMAATYNELYGEDINDVQHHRQVHIFEGNGQAHPIIICVDTLESDSEHVYTLLWHVDSILSQSNKSKNNLFHFTDISIALLGENLNTTVVEGQEEPYIQGFFASSEKQGEYRPIPCMEARSEGKNTELITVFSLDKNIESVSKSLHDSNLELCVRFLDGEVMSFVC